jgi:hypothetical protein
MRSYPNLIPLSAEQVVGIVRALESVQFDTIYGHYFDRVIPTGGKHILESSVKRYVAAVKPAISSACCSRRRYAGRVSAGNQVLRAAQNPDYVKFSLRSRLTKLPTTIGSS